jgi:hypothetical protein
MNNSLTAYVLCFSDIFKEYVRVLSSGIQQVELALEVTPSNIPETLTALLEVHNLYS